MKANDVYCGDSEGTTGLDHLEEISSPEGASPQQAPIPPYSGLSALIEAATSQLSDLADVASLHKSPTPQIVPENIERSLTFPDKLMTLCTDPENSDSITFLPDGKFFALRKSTFQEKIVQYFDGAVANVDEFLDLAENWGFSSIVDHGIVILRHPFFVAGDFERCTRIKYGESPEAVRMHALTTRARGVVKDEMVMLAVPSKRRLSPGHLAREESVISVSSKQKFDEGLEITGDEPLALTQSERKASSGTESDQSCKTATEEDNIRSVALAITTDKLHIINSHDAGEEDAGHLVETAVTSATQEIVTDAITTLLRDEGHSKQTYLKHEKELSRSSIPGVVPVCKQIFSPTISNTAKIDTSGPTKNFEKSALTGRVAYKSTNVPTNENKAGTQDKLENDNKRPTQRPHGIMASFMSDVLFPILQQTPNALKTVESRVEEEKTEIERLKDCNATLLSTQTPLDTPTHIKRSTVSVVTSASVTL